MANDTKQCPYCAETIKAEAIVCRFCGRELQIVPEQGERAVAPGKTKGSPKRQRLGAIVVGAIVVCCGISSILAVFDDSSRSTDDTSTALEAGAEAGAMQVGATATVVNTVRPSRTPRPTSTATPTATPSPTPIGELTVSSVVNLRGGPGTEYPIVGTVAADGVLPIFARTESGWLQVDAEGQIWIAASLVKMEVDAAEIPVAERVPLVPTETPPSTATPGPTSTPTATAPPTATATATVTPTAIPETAGITEWMIQDGMKVGVREIRFDYSLGYFRSEAEKVLVSVYVIAINLSDQTRNFDPDEFSLVDGGGQITYGVLFPEIEPDFSSCTVRPNGVCEGWWTTQIWDRPEVRENLSFRWDPCLIMCLPLETPILQSD